MRVENIRTHFLSVEFLDFLNFQETVAQKKK